MLQLLDDYVAKRITVFDAERPLLHLADCLENIDSRQIYECRGLTSRLVHAECAVGEIEFVGIEDPSEVVDDFRRFIARLPN